MLVLQMAPKMASLLHIMLRSSMQIVNLQAVHMKATLHSSLVVYMEITLLNTLIVISTAPTNAHTALAVVKFVVLISLFLIILRELKPCPLLRLQMPVACSNCAKSVVIQHLGIILECRAAKLARVSFVGVFVPMLAMPVVGVVTVLLRSTLEIDVSIADCRNAWQMA